MDTILYGECVSAGDIAKVRIHGLADKGCNLETDANTGVYDRVFGTEFSVWIGAIGPFPATAVQKTASSVAVRFKEPLDRRILKHFNV